MRNALTVSLLAILLAGAAALGQDSAPEAGQGGAAAESAADAAQQAAGESDASDASDEPVGAAEARAAGDDIDEFIPSEEIPPDEQVTFPVDI